MQRLDLSEPGLPDLQFVLMVGALCTSDLESFNAPASVRETVFNRCWVLLHEGPPPTQKEQRVLNLRLGDEITLEALVNVISQTFEEYGFSELTWEEQPTEPTRESTPEVVPLIERIQKIHPPPDNLEPSPPSSSSPS
jgi:hypothetical protein